MITIHYICSINANTTYMKCIFIVFLLYLPITYTYAQKQPVDHYFNINMSTGNSLIDPTKYGWNYQLQLDYNIIKRVNLGVNYGFNRYNNNNTYSSIMADYVGIKYRHQYVGTSLQFTFISFKNVAFNTDKHYGIYLKGSLNNVNEETRYTNFVLSSTDETFWSKQLSLGINIPIIKRIGVMWECTFLDAYNGNIDLSSPSWKAGVSSQLFKL